MSSAYSYALIPCVLERDANFFRAPQLQPLFLHEKQNSPAWTREASATINGTGAITWKLSSTSFTP